MSSQETSQDIPAHVQSLLLQHWGFSDLRSYQKAPVLDLLHGKHVVTLLPTGGGKSLCFQLPALARGGLCLVLTPLVALMADQCEQLRRKGIRAEAWIGKSGDRVLDNVRFGDVRFLYLSPERLHHPLFQARCEYWNVTTIVIDEAHCISLWGHDFRPAFKHISSLLDRFPKAAWGAFTATATQEVLRDVASQMPPGASVYTAPMRRSNLHYQVSRWGDRDAVLLHDVKRQSGKGLIYVQSRHESEQWSQRLQSAGIAAEAFHAGLSPTEKQRRQHEWISGDLKVLACTSAFGMGIDAPHVRWVFHAGPSPNLESYIQEAGRAGRDGQPASCVLYVKEQDFRLLRERIERQFPEPGEIRKAYQWASNVSHATYGEQPSETLDILDSKHLPALRLLALAGHFELKENRNPESQRGTVTWLSSMTQPRSQSMNDALAQWIERHAKAQPIDIDLSQLTCTLNRELYSPETWTEEKLRMHLETLDGMGHLDWMPESTQWQLTWQKPRQRTNTIVVDRSRLKWMLDKLEKVQEYALSSLGCRAQHLEQAFADDSHESCGHCDDCTNDKKKWRQDIKAALLQGPIQPQNLILSYEPGHRDAIRMLISSWYRSGFIRANQNWIQWSGKEA